MTSLAVVPQPHEGFDDTSARMIVRGDLENAQSRLANARAHIAKLEDVEKQAKRMKQTWESIARGQETLISSLQRV